MHTKIYGPKLYIMDVSQIFHIDLPAVNYLSVCVVHLMEGISS